jgi:hypothetical protein
MVLWTNKQEILPVAVHKNGVDVVRLGERGMGQEAWPVLVVRDDVRVAIAHDVVRLSGGQALLRGGASRQALQQLELVSQERPA